MQLWEVWICLYEQMISMNSSASVITASYSKWTKYHSSGYINPTPFGNKSFKSCLNKSRAEEAPVIGMKNVYSLKSLSDAEELYSVCLIITLEMNIINHIHGYLNYTE